VRWRRDHQREQGFKGHMKGEKDLDAAAADGVDLGALQGVVLWCRKRGTLGCYVRFSHTTINYKVL
jgi:hypothetical protein